MWLSFLREVGKLKDIIIKENLILKMCNKKFSRCSYSVFLYLLTILNSEYPIFIRNIDIHKAIGFNESSISSALNMLVKESILQKGKTSNRKLGFKLWKD